MTWDYKTSHRDHYELLKVYARQNRHNMTEAESVLWMHLRNKFIGTKVIRQHIIGDYIVDFLLPHYNLIIEVDGAYHAERQQHEDDLARSEWLNKMGYYVMRFTNEEVLFDIDSTIEKIKYIINKLETTP